ncbi:hypothetical protein CEB3_c35350 [Peptococcaceae bacterium CEB3]|nr:hypothetical protein CEB3_c35350 [Peptococcaceae bacterium CEB3]
MKKVSLVVSLVVILTLALVGCGTNVSQTSNKQGGSQPVTITFYSLGGTDNYFHDILVPMFEKATKGKYKVQYGRGPWQQIVNKIKAEGKNVDIDVLATGLDGLAGGMQAGVWQQLNPAYAPDIHYAELNKFGKEYTDLFQGYGVPAFTSYGGPMLVYNSDKVKQPPTTYAELKVWAAAHPDKFMYATVPTSGPSRGFYFGLIHSLGENINQPDSLSETWNYLTTLGKNITSYPAASGDTFKFLNDGTVYIVPHLPGWYAQQVADGTLAKNIKAVMLTGVPQFLDAQFYVMPKNISPDAQKAALAFINFAMSKEAESQLYAIVYPPTNKNASVAQMLPRYKANYEKELAALPNQLKSGDNLIIPSDSLLFPNSEVTLAHYKLWQEKIQANK